MNQELIRKEAKQLLDNFAKSLDNVKVKPKKIPQETKGFREESIPEKPNKEFKNKMFANAPKTNGDFIISEKKKW